MSHAACPTARLHSVTRITASQARTSGGMGRYAPYTPRPLGSRAERQPPYGLPTLMSDTAQARCLTCCLHLRSTDFLCHAGLAVSTATFPCREGSSGRRRHDNPTPRLFLRLLEAVMHPPPLRLAQRMHLAASPPTPKGSAFTCILTTPTREFDAT